jgi:hypothetical protein
MTRIRIFSSRSRSSSTACREDNRLCGFSVAYACDLPWFRTSRLSFSRRRRLLAFFAQLSDHRTRQYPSRLLRDYLSILPYVNRRAVHAGGFAGNFRRAPQRPSDGCRKLFSVFSYFDSFHGPLSNNWDVPPELSYTLHVSARSL